MSRLIVAVVLLVTYAALLIGIMVKNIDVGYAETVMLSIGGVLAMVNLGVQFEYWSSQQWKKK